MARSDFNYIPVNQKFNNNNDNFRIPFRVELSAGQKVVDDGYLLITVRDVDSNNHEIAINGHTLTGFDIPKPPADSSAWFTYMDRIQPEANLHSGTNILEIHRVGDDNFEVKDLVINWRES